MAEESGRGPDRPVVVIGVGLIAVAGIVVWQALGLRASFGNQAIGPQMMPFVVGLLLAGLGVLTVLEGVRGTAPPREDEQWLGVIWIAAGLAVMIAMIKTVGFIPAAAILFAATARAFGSARTLVDLAIGAVIALVIYLFFVKVLGLSLPSGFTESWI